MTGSETIIQLEGAGSPEVRLLDARTSGLDDRALREWAHALTAGSRAPYVSRSYRYPYALVGWHREPVGVDIERVSPCDTAFADLICTPAERSDATCATDSDSYLTSLWCAKEALAKTLGNALCYEPSRLESPARWPQQRAGPLRAARLSVAVDHVAWVCWRSSDAAANPEKVLKPGRERPSVTPPS